MNAREKVFWARQNLRREHIKLIDELCVLGAALFMPEQNVLNILIQDIEVLNEVTNGTVLLLKSMSQVEPIIPALLISSTKRLLDDPLD